MLCALQHLYLLIVGPYLPNDERFVQTSCYIWQDTCKCYLIIQIHKLLFLVLWYHMHWNPYGIIYFALYWNPRTEFKYVAFSTYVVHLELCSVSLTLLLIGSSCIFTYFSFFLIFLAYDLKPSLRWLESHLNEVSVTAGAGLNYIKYTSGGKCYFTAEMFKYRFGRVLSNDPKCKHFSLLLTFVKWRSLT